MNTAARRSLGNENLDVGRFVELVEVAVVDAVSVRLIQFLLAVAHAPPTTQCKM